MVRDKSFSHHDSKEALQQQGRAVCHLVNRSGRPYLDNLLYELVNDPGVQAEFRDSLGLCERHAYLMLEQGLTSGWEWWTWRSWLWPRSWGRT